MTQRRRGLRLFLNLKKALLGTMKLTRFKIFAKALRRTPDLAAKSPRIFRLFDGKWYDEEGNLVSEVKTVQALGSTLKSGVKPWRGKNSRECYFPVTELAAVLVLEFPKAPTSSTQNFVQRTINECYNNSKNEFVATYDTLTELRNRSGFEECLTSVLGNLCSSTPPTTPSLSLPGGGLALLALDIDHFKQLNDNFGHQYGDIVLAAFAWRVDKVASKLAEELGIRISTGRIGGEEFQILLEGVSNIEDELKVAAEIRKTISESPLPSDDEWRVLTRERGDVPFSLPHSSERRVTTSVGHASLGERKFERAEMQKVVSILTREADTALYRAKQDGRNCVRSFREIRDRLGRVIEHHPDTDVVVIDIGTNVGVNRGHEFLVYHPQFCGDVPFMFSDGRTNRRLGQYPKYPAGRISVFEIDHEICFCKVLENRLSGLFPVGTRLEYVPLGSITHLVTDGVLGAVAPFDSLQSLDESIKKLMQTEKNVLAVAFSLHEIAKVVDERGVAVANQALAQLYRLIRSSFPTAKLTQVGASEFVIVTSYEEPRAEDLLGKIDAVVAENPDGPKCLAGVFMSTRVDTNNYRIEFAVDFARLALRTEQRVAIFNSHTPTLTIQEWRRAGKPEEGLADYSRMKRYGITSADLENIAGLCYAELPSADLPRAQECFEAAVFLEPDEVVYKLNLAYVHSRSGEYAEAYSEFSLHLAYLTESVTTHQAYWNEYLRSALYCLKNLPEHGVDGKQLRELMTYAEPLVKEKKISADLIARVELALF